jgi:hypothetical protein
MADGGDLDGILELKDLANVIKNVTINLQQEKKKGEQPCLVNPPQLEVAVSELKDVKAAHEKLVAERNELIRALQSSSSLVKVNWINLKYFLF